MGQTELPDKGRLACSLGLLKPPVFSLLPFFFFVNILFIIFLLHLLSCCWLLQTLICSRLFFNYYVLCLYFFGRQKYCCIILDFTTILNTYYTAFHLLVCGLLGFFLSFLLFYTS